MPLLKLAAIATQLEEYARHAPLIEQHTKAPTLLQRQRAAGGCLSLNADWSVNVVDSGVVIWLLLGAGDSACSDLCLWTHQRSPLQPHDFCCHGAHRPPGECYSPPTHPVLMIGLPDLQLDITSDDQHALHQATKQHAC